MSASEREYAHLMLRLILNGDVAPADMGAIDWETIAVLARRNAVLLRLADALACIGVHPPPAFAAAEASERDRVRGAAALVAALDRACTGHAIPHVFPKIAPYDPDLGSDVDLLVRCPAPVIAALLEAEVPAFPLPRHIGHRIADTTKYRVPGSHVHLDVHHGRLGRFGEQAGLTDALLRGRQRGHGTHRCFVPAPEHQLVLQGLDRVFGRRSFRLGDVLYTITITRGGDLDWDEVARTAVDAGIQPGLAAYLRYVEQIHERVFGAPLLPADVRTDLALARRSSEGRVEFRGGAFRFPALRVNGRLYIEQITADARAGRWGRIARMCLMAVAGMASQWQRLTGVDRRTSAEDGVT